MSALTALPFVDAEQVQQLLDPRTARELLEGVLLEGFDPTTDPARSHLDTGNGQLLLMPSALADWVGVKLATVAPGNVELGLPRIHAVYVLFDAVTMQPRLLIDGIALTNLRTPAVSALAADHLSDPNAQKVLIVGSGPQAIGHAVALAALRRLTDIVITARRPEGVQRAVEELRGRGLPARSGTADEVADADLIVTATSAATPVFDGSLIGPGACVLAIGSHSPDQRELDSELMGRSQVVIEDRATAERECGDVVLAAVDGALSIDRLGTLAELVNGRLIRASDRPNVFKGSGMAWQDLAIAAGIAQRL